MSPEHADLLVVAGSARGLAQSAVRAGWRVTAIDAFGDLDTQRACADTIVSRFDRPADLHHAVDRALSLRRYQGCLFGGGLEAHPEVLRQISERIPLWGNPPSVLARLANARDLLRVLARCQVPHPQSQLDAPASGDTGWLCKRADSCGGQAVSRSPVATGGGTYWQRRIPGRAYSLLFLADGCDLRAIGWNELLPPATDDFRYRGAITDSATHSGLRDQVLTAAGALVAGLGLRGLNGIDFVVADDRALVIDINPRPTATMELHDTDEGRVIAAHISACVDRRLPAWTATATAVRGHRVCHARHNGRVGRHQWPSWSSDLPAFATAVEAGAALCTVHAQGASRASVVTALDGRARAVHRTWSQPVPAMPVCA